MTFSGDSYNEFLVLIKAGTIGSMAACVLGTPLDVARHSAQAAVAARRATPGMGEALRAAAQPGILSGLWRGLPLALGRALLSPAAFLLVYQQQKAHREAVEAGVVARTVQTLLVQPLEFLRTCRQAGALLAPAARVHLDRSTWQIVVSDGLRSFWRGLIPTLARDVPASAIFWTSYMGLQQRFGDEQGRQLGSPAVRAAVFASTSAIVAAVVTQPLDLVKTKMQVHQLVRSNQDGYKKVNVARFFKTFWETHRAVGVAGLWTGGLPRIITSAACGFLLGPFFEYGLVIAQDADRPLRKPFILPEDPSATIVHPRSTRSMFIEVKERFSWLKLDARLKGGCQGCGKRRGAHRIAQGNMDCSRGGETG
eukprot:CAMPEP_0179071174 /NCGR_PEP_ID=MMETSP0796-20121207/31397_1 /TAXON_ID=73915 /ORGANISM="Pyrodinium bahamense, Strain pbaha01" /LENGTH=366 /DNA_ID=CAMNT_0020768283 /DNA_START=1 /DNA_END=1099 /DNA_ORIENTATION=-